MVGKTIFCEIETDIENAEFAFYVIIDGDRKATFWYTDRPSIEYACGDEIINEYEIVFFIRINGSEIVSKSITKKSNWSLDEGVLEAVRQLANKDSIILEFGSGLGSQSLSEICTVYSIEHDERFLNKYESVNYIHAPLIDIEPLPEFGESKWYDLEIIKLNLPPKIDIIIVDGPPEKYGRSGLIRYLQTFSDVKIWFIDDVLRTKDQKLSNIISIKNNLYHYRFWNFSILAKAPVRSDVIQSVYSVTQKIYENKSSLYIKNYYPSLFES